MTLPLDETLVAKQADSGDCIERLLDRHELAFMLQKLTSDQQDVIILKFVEGLSNAEVGKVLGKSEGAIKSLQYRALRRLVKIVKAHDS